MFIRIKGCLCAPCKGGDHDWEFNSLLLSEQRVAQKTTGIVGAEAFMKAVLDDDDADAWCAFLVLLHKRSGVILKSWDEVELDPLTIVMEPSEEEKQAKAKAEAEASQGKEDPAEGTSDGSTSGTSTEGASSPRPSTTDTSSGATTASPT